MSSEEDQIPALKVVRALGGLKATASYIGRSESLVRRWPMPKEKGGMGGLVRADHQIVLIEAAISDRKPLRLEDFFPTDLVARLAASNAALAEERAA